MKPLFLLGLGLALSLHAQVPSSPPAATPPPPSADQQAQTLLGQADLDTLLGPIALYPDALIGLILPASTTPTDIVLAARTLGTNTSADTLAAQPWDDSVKALTHYPDLLRWLDQNLTWTRTVGEAFAAQPADVMNTVQRLRQKARDAGTLVDTPQQQIVARDDALLIVPAQPDVIYVPVYDPTVVYVSHPVRIRHTYLYFHSAYRTGPWLCYRPDWQRGNLHVIYHHHHHRPHSHYIHHPSHPGSSSHVWAPRPVHPRPHTHVRTTPPAEWRRSPAQVGRSSQPDQIIRSGSSLRQPSAKLPAPFLKSTDPQPSRQRKDPALTRDSRDSRSPLVQPRDNRSSSRSGTGTESDAGFFQTDSSKSKKK